MNPLPPSKAAPANSRSNLLDQVGELVHARGHTETAIQSMK